MDTVQRSHHDVGTDHIPLSNNRSVHDLSSEGCSISLCPLANSALWTACRHDSARFAKNNPKIFLLGHIKIITAVKRLFQNRDKKYHNAVHNNTKSNNPNTADCTHRH